MGDADAAAALATTTGGHAVTIDLARTCGYDDDVRTELVGSHGALLIEAAGQGRLRLGDASGLRDVPGPGGDLLAGALAAQLERFAGACAGAPAHATADDAARALAAALAMREARIARRCEVLRTAVRARSYSSRAARTGSDRRGLGHGHVPPGLVAGTPTSGSVRT